MQAGHDVAIIGGGIAGLCAGVRAAELGLSVVVLERGRDPDYLCNSRVAGGVFHVAHEDPHMPRDALFDAIIAASYGKADPAVARALANGAAGTIDWLAGLGIGFIRAGAYARDAPMAAPPRPLGEKLDWMTTWRDRGPDRLLRVLTERFAALGGRLVLNANARSLVMRDGACAGVEAEVAGRPGRFEAKAVVIADGGFQANAEMVRRHIGPSPEGIRARNTGTSFGDGIRMAQEAGAAITELGGFYGHVLSRDAIDNPQLWPYPLLDELAVNGMVVDETGSRFCDEGVGGVYIANAIAKRTRPLATAVICDAAIWEKSSQRPHVSAPNPRLAEIGATIHSAATIEDLARQAGIPPQTLRASVEAYNAACRRGAFDTLAPPRSARKAKPMPILQAPFLAIPACAGMTFTMGGIRIDGDARALRRDGTPLPGLYAAGSCTGGVEGGEKAAYISGLSKAAIFGKLAAEHIAGTLGPRPAADAPPRQVAVPLARPAAYPVLGFLVRHGGWLSMAVGLVPLLAALAAAILAPGPFAGLTLIGGLIGSGVLFLAARSYVELVRLIVDTLLPK
jgi:fumarate reductase flavoprotein subunit